MTFGIGQLSLADSGLSCHITGSEADEIRIVFSNGIQASSVGTSQNTARLRNAPNHPPRSFIGENVLGLWLHYDAPDCRLQVTVDGNEFLVIFLVGLAEGRLIQKLPGFVFFSEPARSHLANQ